MPINPFFTYSRINSDPHRWLKMAWMVDYRRRLVAPKITPTITAWFGSELARNIHPFEEFSKHFFTAELCRNALVVLHFRFIPAELQSGFLSVWLSLPQPLLR